MNRILEMIGKWRWRSLLEPLNAGLVILSVLSFVTTASGIFTMIRPHALTLLGGAGDLLAGGFAIFVSAMVQLLIVGAWRQFAIMPLRHIAHLIVAITMSTVSWYGGSAGLHLLMHAEDMVSDKSAAQAQALATPLARYSTDYAGTVANILVFSENMERLATEEGSVGGTCGQQRAAIEICGPACRLRNSHAQRLKQVAQEAQQYGNDTRAAATRFVSATSVKEQAAAFTVAASLETSPTPARVAAVLNEVSLELSGSPVWRDPDTGKPVSCRDPALAQKASVLAAAAAVRPMVGLAPPKAVTVTVNDSAACVASQLNTLWSAKAEGCASAKAPIAAQGIMEGLLVMMLLSSVLRQRRLGLVKSERSEADFPLHLDPNNPQSVELARAMVAAMRSNVITTQVGMRKTSFLIAEPSEQCPGAWLADQLELDDPHYCRVPLVTIDRFFAERFASPLVDVYILDDRARAELKLARDVLRAARAAVDWRYATRAILDHDLDGLCEQTCHAS